MTSTTLTRPSGGARRGSRRRALTGALLGAGLLLSVAACGSDDGDGSSDGSGGDQAAAADDGAADDGGAGDGAESDGGSGDGAESDTADEPQAGSDGGGEYCGAVATMGNDMMSDLDPSDSEATADLAGQFRDVATVAPQEIAGDWTTLADAMELMADIDYSDPDAVAKLEELGDMTAVGERIQQHIQSECG